MDTAPRLDADETARWAGPLAPPPLPLLPLPHSSPNQSRGSSVSVTGMESRKLVLWTSEGASPEGEVGERALGVGAVVSEDGESRSGEVWGREDELNV